MPTKGGNIGEENHRHMRTSTISRSFLCSMQAIFKLLISYINPLSFSGDLFFQSETVWISAVGEGPVMIIPKRMNGDVSAGQQGAGTWVSV